MVGICLVSHMAIFGEKKDFIRLLHEWGWEVSFTMININQHIQPKFSTVLFALRASRSVSAE